MAAAGALDAAAESPGHGPTSEGELSEDDLEAEEEETEIEAEVDIAEAGGTQI